MSGIEAAEGFVHEQGGGVDGEGAGEADALLHSAAHLPGVILLPSVEADGLNGFGGRRVALVFVHALNLQAVGYVVNDVAVGEEAVVLEDHGDLVAPELYEFFGGVFEDVLAVEDDLAPGGFD